MAGTKSRFAPDQANSEENLNVHFSCFQQFVESTVAVVFPNQEKRYAAARGGAQFGQLGERSNRLQQHQHTWPGWSVQQWAPVYFAAAGAGFQCDWRGSAIGRSGGRATSVRHARKQFSPQWTAGPGTRPSCPRWQRSGDRAQPEQWQQRYD